MSAHSQSRRGFIASLAAVLTGAAAGALPWNRALAVEADDAALKQRFAYLSTNGNSSCSRQFRESIAGMPVTALIQGSCCSPMDEHRYIEQVKGLRAFRDIAMIPADPYDLPAALAQRLMPYYELALTDAEQAAYDFAMENSNEQGPCCCQCWRWHVYGGLAKYLIREQRFTGEKIARIWDLSDGCGGSGEHVH